MKRVASDSLDPRRVCEAVRNGLQNSDLSLLRVKIQVTTSIAEMPSRARRLRLWRSPTDRVYHSKIYEGRLPVWIFISTQRPYPEDSRQQIAPSISITS